MQEQKKCPYLSHIYTEDLALHRHFCTGCGKQMILRCVRSNCNNEGTHHVRSGDFGCSYCDKHWYNRDLETERRLLMN